MNWVAWKMLNGDTAKYLGAVFGVAFGVLLITQQASIFVGLMSRTANPLRDVREARVWVTDRHQQNADEIEPISDGAVHRIRGVEGMDWAVRLYKGVARARRPDGIFRQVILLGIDDHTFVGAPRTILMGDLADLRRPSAVFIDKAGSNFRRSPPVRRQFSGTVAGAGVVEPRSESIHLSTEVPGVVAEVAVREGQFVAAGDVVLRLEDRWKRAELEVCQAALAAAGQDLAKLRGLPRPEDLPPSAARVRGAQAAAETQRDQLARAEDLHRQKVVTEQEVIQRRKAFDTAQAALEEAQAEDARLRAGAWERDVAIAAAAVEQARASVDLARVEVERFVVRSPVAGTVLRVDVRPGEFVGTPPGKPLVVFGDTTRLHVRVSIDEHDLPRFIPGAPALGYPRGDGEHPVRLSFLRAVPTVAPKQNLNGDSAERVDTRVLQVLFEIVDDTAAVSPTDGPPGRDLFVGQQLDVQINAAAR